MIEVNIKTIDDIAYEIYNMIKRMPTGSEFVIGEFFNDYEIDMESKFKVQEEILNLCKENQINIVNTQPDEVLGMPWVFTYKKM